MNNRFYWSVVALVALLFVACVKEPTPTSPEPTPTPVVEPMSFEVSILATTRMTMSFSVTPSRLDGDYICYVMERGDVEDFVKDRYLVATIYQELTELAGESGETLEEYLPTIVDRGVIEESRFSGMTADTEYFLLLFTVDATKGYELVGEVIKVPFATQSVEASDATFEVETAVENNGVRFAVTPSDGEMRWHLVTVAAESYRRYTDPEQGYGMSDSYYFQDYMRQEIESYASQGYSDERIIEAMFLRGAQQLEAKRLRARTEYVYLVAGVVIDSEGIVVVTPITMGSYTTGDVVRVDMTFDIEVWDVGQLSASVRITPTNDEATYCALIQPWDGVTEAQDMMHNLVEQWGGWMDIMANDRGAVEHSGANAFKLPAADTDYYVIAFGYEGGITTDAVMKTFRTLPGGSVEEVEFRVEAANITPYSFEMEVASSDNTIYYIAGACPMGEYAEEEFIAAENEYFDYLYTESKKFNAMITVAEVLDQYYYAGNGALRATNLRPDTEYMVYIFAVDVRTGHVVKSYTFDSVALTASLGIANPSVTLVGYFSGDEEAGVVFNDAAATKGRAITVVKYENLDNVRTLFTTLLPGDYSNSASYSDSEMWALAEGYWSRGKVASPYSFYLADWNVEMTAMAYATDNSGKIGYMGRLYTKPTAYEKLPIEQLAELVASLGGVANAAYVDSSLVVGAEIE